MGCSDSRVIETNGGSVSKKAPSKHTKSSDDGSSFTVREFFDTILALPERHGKPYIQPELPDFYVEQSLSFSNDNVDSNIWDTRITVDKQSKKTQERGGKKRGSDSELTWHYRKPPNRKYLEPDDSVTIQVEYEPTAKKKAVVVVSGLYLGSKAASPHNALESINAESTHSLVLLGNVFDMLSIDPFHQIPMDITKVEEILGHSKAVLATIRNLAERVNVYYMLGSHDTHLTRVAIERLLGDRVTYIQQTNLILCVKVGNESYRVRLTSGQQWDFLNDRKLPTEKLLVGNPIGHYLSRAAANNPRFSSSALMKPLVSAIPAQLSKDFLQEISKRPLQDRITSKLLMCAFQLSMPEDLINIKCLVDEGKYMSVQPILEYPYIKYLTDKHGEEMLMSMFKAMTGDYSCIAREFGEDIMITGLGDEASISKVATASGQEVICASTGSCSQRSDRMTMVKVLFPRQGSNGKVEIVVSQPEPSVEQNGVVKPQPVSTDDKADTMSVESL